jgi:hypothetical protein
MVLISVVIILDTEQEKSDLPLFKEQNKVSAWVQTAFVIIFAFICFHATWLLKQSRVKVVHTIETFWVSINTIVVSMGVILFLLAFLLVAVAYTNVNLNA